MIPNRSVLGGLPYNVAKSFGMPHIGCEYRGSGVNTLRIEEGARCAICGRRATNAHHEPPKGMGGRNSSFTLRTSRGLFTLKPAGFALCGSGTTGCHYDRHRGLWLPEWFWDNSLVKESWWSGYLLSRGIKPHSPELYEYGCWKFLDADKNVILGVRN